MIIVRTAVAVGACIRIRYYLSAGTGLAGQLAEDTQAALLAAPVKISLTLNVLPRAEPRGPPGLDLFVHCPCILSFRIFSLSAFREVFLSSPAPTALVMASFVLTSPCRLIGVTVKIKADT